MKKKLIKLTEADLHNVIKECVSRVLNEDSDIDSYYGGGLPYMSDDEVPENGRIGENELLELDKLSTKIADIANNSSDDTDLLFKAIENIDKFVELQKGLIQAK